MEILKPLKFILKYIGLLFTYSDSFWYKILGFYCCFSITLLIYPVGKYVNTTLTDVTKFSEIMPVYAGMLNSVYKTIWFLFYREEVKYLLIKMQENIDKKSQRCEDLTPYVKADKSADSFVKNFAYSMTGAIFFLIFGPVTFVLYHYLRGDLSNELMKLPIDALFPYDHTYLPAYVLTYFASCVSLYFMAYTVVSIDSFFMGMCLHIIACLNDLMDSFTQLDKRLKSNNEFLQKLIERLNFHREIFEYVRILEKFASPIILGQFFISLAELCTLAFDIIMNKNITMERLFMFIVCLSQLYIYCYFGNELTLTLLKVSETIYSLKWYEREAHQQKYFLFFILRAQKPYYMRGVKMITCSLETFTHMLNLVGSLFTILRTTLEG